MNKHAANVAKWRPVFEVSAQVRVKKGVTPYGGRTGYLVSRGVRPDGRIYWETYLYLSSGHSTPSTREYYQDELELT